MSGSDEVEIKAVLTFKSFLRNPVRTQVITDLEFTPFDENEMAKRPGIEMCIRDRVSIDQISSPGNRFHGLYSTLDLSQSKSKSNSAAGSCQSIVDHMMPRNRYMYADAACGQVQRA